MVARLDRVISKDVCKFIKSDLRLERLSLYKISHVVFLYVISVCCLTLLQLKTKSSLCCSSLIF